MHPVIIRLSLALCVAGCGATTARLRYVSSRATQATWSFVVDDRARGAELLIDGRPRAVGCDRAGGELRCELRGLWPGGHTVELRLPGAVLKRSALVGRSWSARPALVRVSDAGGAAEAAKAGADGVVVESTLPDPAEVIDAAHAHGIRALVHGDATLVEAAGADGVLGVPLPPLIAAHFPEARAFMIDEPASRDLAAMAPDRITSASALVEASGLVAGALALTAPRGAIVDRATFPILAGRQRHAALREGVPREVRGEGRRYTIIFTAGNDAVTLFVNGGTDPWRVAAPAGAIDLLGTGIVDGGLTIAANDVALLVPVPERDRTRY